MEATTAISVETEDTQRFRNVGRQRDELLVCETPVITTGVYVLHVLSASTRTRLQPQPRTSEQSRPDDGSPRATWLRPVASIEC